MGTAKVNNIDVIYIGSEMNFHFIWYLWNELCVLYPRASGEGIPYEMKIYFRFFLSHVKLTKTQEKHSFIEFYYQFYCGKRANVGALPMTS